jgi:VCBS repeat protein
MFLHAACWGAPLFGEPRAYPVGTSPVGIAFGDVDGMPGPDLVTADEGNTLSVLTNHGDGVFDHGKPLRFSTRYTATGIVSGQLNGDTVSDFAISADDNENPDFNGAVVLFRSSAALQYTTTATTVGLFPTCITFADLTGDAIADLASCGSASDGSGLISLLPRNADNSFAATVGIALGDIFPNRLIVADIDHDARPDLLVLDTGGNAAWILYSRGAGPVFDPPVRLATIDAPAAAVIAPFGTDTLPDIAIVSRLDGAVLVFRQTEARVFSAPTAYPVGLFPVDLAAADFNHDDVLDFVSANNGSSDVTLLLGTADGGFRQAETVGVGDGPVAITVADLNGDQRPDFATANQDDERFGADVQSVSVVLNGVSPPFTPTPTGSAVGSSTPTPTSTPPTSTPSPTPTPVIGTPTITPTPAGPGDVNCDGRFNAGDLDSIIRLIFDPTAGCLDRPATAADIPFIIDLLSTAP